MVWCQFDQPSASVRVEMHNIIIVLCGLHVFLFWIPSWTARNLKIEHYEIYELAMTTMAL